MISLVGLYISERLANDFTKDSRILKVTIRSIDIYYQYYHRSEQGR